MGSCQDVILRPLADAGTFWSPLCRHSSWFHISSGRDQEGQGYQETWDQERQKYQETLHCNLWVAVRETRWCKDIGQPKSMNTSVCMLGERNQETQNMWTLDFAIICHSSTFCFMIALPVFQYLCILTSWSIQITFWNWKEIKWGIFLSLHSQQPVWMCRNWQLTFDMLWRGVWLCDSWWRPSPVFPLFSLMLPPPSCFFCSFVWHCQMRGWLALRLFSPPLKILISLKVGLD